MREEDDATVWIGYADFLTTLTILFFVLAIVFAAKSNVPLKITTVTGVVQDGETHRTLASCDVWLADQHMKTDRQGTFNHRFDGLQWTGTISLTVDCPQYVRHSELMTVEPGKSFRKVVLMTPLPPDPTLEIIRLPGDALFDKNKAELRPEAITMIMDSVATSLQMRPDEILIVEGHTDDLPFAPGVGIDNWILSGQRAAAAAKILTEPQYGIGIPECQVAIMGFGPSRPVEPVRPSDSFAEKQRKRTRNRRIEFRKLRGSAMITGNCIDELPP